MEENLNLLNIHQISIKDQGTVRSQIDTYGQRIKVCNIESLLVYVPVEGINVSGPGPPEDVTGEKGRRKVKTQK